ncbi:phage portal protein [Glycocaulis profundi]|nr:phage portal protein [Glycocaulis profundi]
MLTASEPKPRYRVPAASRRVSAGAPGLMAADGPARAPFRAADLTDQVLGGWHGSRGSADRDWLMGRMTAIARSRDAARNDPLAGGVVRRKRAMVVGWGWIFTPQPDAEALGIDTRTEEGWDQYDALVASMKREWRYWAEDPVFRCDWEEQLDFDLMLMLAVTHKIIDGEAVGILCWREREDAFRYSTALHLVDPDLLENPMGRPDSDTLRAGIELDEDGRPGTYHFRRQHPADVGIGMGAMTWDAIPAREDWGRPRVVHLYEKKRAGQHRGIGDLVSSLRRFRTLEAYTDAELRSKVINALVVAQYTSNMGGEMLAEIFGQSEAKDLMALREKFYTDSDVSVAGSKVINTFPGDELKWNTESRETDDYADFAHAIASQCAGPAGSTYEMITGDFTRHNYSSGRMSKGEAWREIEVERAMIAKQFATPIRLCVMEEAWYAGRLALPPNAPDFWDEVGAYVRGEWIGPPPGDIDPVKEPQGRALRMANYSASPQQIAAEEGRDLDEVIDEVMHAKRRLQRHNLVPADLATILGVRGPTDAPEADPQPEPRNR